MQNETLTPMAFQFNATSQEIRSLLIESDPWFAAKDVCEILGHSNNKVAIKALDDDEVRKVYLTDSLGRDQLTNVVNESGLYALIMRSNKPESKVFRKWVTSEVLPALRKHGVYGKRNLETKYLDLRDVPYDRVDFAGHLIRRVLVDEEPFYCLVDVLDSIGSKTKANQTAKRLNMKQTLAVKIWLFGDTNPGWYTNELGVKLVSSGSRVVKSGSQLMLGFQKGGGDA